VGRVATSMFLFSFAASLIVAEVVAGDVGLQHVQKVHSGDPDSRCSGRWRGCRGATGKRSLEIKTLFQLQR
jgi:hypothetical protein